MPKFVETNFDERSGFVKLDTPWGYWYQTVADVQIIINVKPGTSAKQVKVDLKPKFICVKVHDEIIIKGQLFGVVFEDELIWTLEDQKEVRIVLSKSDVEVKENIWEGLLVDQYSADPWVLHEMRKKLDLERFEIENPGFNFTNAKLKKSYDNPSATAVAEWQEKQKEKS